MNNTHNVYNKFCPLNQLTPHANYSTAPVSCQCSAPVVEEKQKCPSCGKEGSLSLAEAIRINAENGRCFECANSGNASPVEEKCSHGPTIGCPSCPNSTGIGYSTAPVEEKHKDGCEVTRFGAGSECSCMMENAIWPPAPTALSDWELVFKRKFTNDGSVLVRQKKPTPWMLTITAQQVINFIRSVEHAAILRTRERVVREALEKMPREINLGAPILGLGSFSFGQGYNKALAEFRTLLSSLNQESHE